jgi:deoxyribodipyrimidine photo-lyase
VFLTCFPPLRRHPVDGFPLKAPGPDWDRARRMAARIPAHGTAGAGPGPGPDAAARRLRLFLRAGLDAYPDTRNDPVADGQSGLSAYLHFGQLAPQRAALEVWNAGGASPAARDALLEELIVRRELSDNFCLYTPAYDSTDAFPAWARTTLEAHASDPRPALYPADRLEAARTDDALWNAAQRQLLVAGKMHGYLRMYWGKKILEWSRDPAEALERVLTLNDRYSYDGRDPNGYAGGAWCVGGVHDRAWPERPVFGKVRYMNAAGCRRKFDVDAYLRKIDQLTS